MSSDIETALEFAHCSCDVCDGTRYLPADDARQLQRELNDANARIAALEAALPRPNFLRVLAEVITDWYPDDSGVRGQQQLRQWAATIDSVKKK